MRVPLHLTRETGECTSGMAKVKCQAKFLAPSSRCRLRYARSLSHGISLHLRPHEQTRRREAAGGQHWRLAPAAARPAGAPQLNGCRRDRPHTQHIRRVGFLHPLSCALSCPVSHGAHNYTFTQSGGGRRKLAPVQGPPLAHRQSQLPLSDTASSLLPLLSMPAYCSSSSKDLRATLSSCCTREGSLSACAARGGRHGRRLHDVARAPRHACKLVSLLHAAHPVLVELAFDVGYDGIPLDAGEPLRRL